MSLVAAIDVVSFLAVIIAIVILWRGWNRALTLDIKMLVAGLLGLSLFHHVSNILEWGKINTALDPFEDFVELLVPMVWFMLVFNYLKELSTGDLREREKALRESEGKYRRLFEIINDAVFVHILKEDGTPGHFLEVNDIACQRLGYTRAELLQITPLEIGPGKVKANPTDTFKALKEHGTPAKHGAIFRKWRTAADHPTVFQAKRFQNAKCTLIAPLLVLVVPPKILVAKSYARETIHPHRQPGIGPVLLPPAQQLKQR